MQFDLGGTVPLAWTIKDSTGALADGGSLSFSIVQPDGTTAGPTTPTHASLGKYTGSGVAAQAGRHIVTLTVTGANAGVYVDTYDVVDYSGIQVVSVTDALAELNLDKTPDPTVYVPELRGYILGISAVIESIVGKLAVVTYDEWYDGGYPTISLLNVPVVSVTSVVETWGAGATRTLTLQPPDTSSDAYGYSVDVDTATITRRINGVAGPFAAGRRNVHVVYKAGRSAVPPNVRMGALELIRINWQPQTGGNRPGYEGPSDVVDGSFRMGFYVPNRVMEQLVPSVVDFGIA